MFDTQKSSLDPMIRVDGLHKSFGATPVLQSIDLEVLPGEIFALLGANGAGKTTLVNILSTLLPYDSGTASIAGFDVARQAQNVRGVISLTGQYAAVDNLLTARENLIMMARLHGFGAQAKHRAEELLAQFDLTDAADRRVETYSGGMRRRVDIAISLVAQPDVLFLDEPTTGLDPRSRNAVWEFIRALAHGGTTVLLTTQYLEEADALADRIAVLHNGHIVANGTSSELKARIGATRLIVSFADDTNHEVTTDGSIEQLHQEFGVLVHDTRTATNIELRTPTLDDVFMSLTQEQSSDTWQDERAVPAEKGNS